MEDESPVVSNDLESPINTIKGEGCNLINERFCRKDFFLLIFLHLLLHLRQALTLIGMRAYRAYPEGTVVAQSIGCPRPITRYAALGFCVIYRMSSRLRGFTGQLGCGVIS